MIIVELRSFVFSPKAQQVATKTQTVHNVPVRSVPFDIAAVFSRIKDSEVIGIEIVLVSICCGKQKLTMSPLRGTPPCGNPKQGSRAKKLDSRFRGNDKYCFRNRY
ncbi:hypothetical protein ES703_111699 [subsurface metagenome]